MMIKIKNATLISMSDKRERVEVGKEEKRLPKMGEALESLSLMIKEAGERFRLPTKEEAERCCSAAREEIIRRYYGTSQKAIITAYKDAIKKYKEIKEKYY